MGTETVPLVSICCFTYNHENYIRDAIEGFLMQITNFPFEIIIHDDASTDKTVDVIREYESKYPEIIKPIYQTENQYSKGERVELFTFKAARGKYIALCEGDDYWIDPLKLQKQIAEMEIKPECQISFHPAIKKWVSENRADEILGKHFDKTTVVSVEDVISSIGIFMPTASIIISRPVVSKIVSFFDFAKEAPVGDYYIQVLGATNGGALYLNDTMCVYRYKSSGSWTTRLNEVPGMRGAFLCSSISSHDKLNTFTDNKYSKLIIERKAIYCSNLIKLVHLDIGAKERIIEENLGIIKLRDRVLWNTVYKHNTMIRMLRHIYGTALTARRVRMKGKKHNFKR